MADLAPCQCGEDININFEIQLREQWEHSDIYVGHCKLCKDAIVTFVTPWSRGTEAYEEVYKEWNRVHNYELQPMVIDAIKDGMSARADANGNLLGRDTAWMQVVAQEISHRIMKLIQ